MDEFNLSAGAINETDDRREIIKQKLRQYYDGRIVRKDLTKSIREGANVPVYVLEYLLGQYCNSDDQEIIDEGVDNVKRILRDNYVRPDEAQKILSLLRERGSYTLDGQSVNTMDALSKLAQQMGASTAFSATECAEALNYLALAGYDTQEMADTLPTVLNLAAAGGIDLASASDMVTDAMSALGMETSDADKMVDQMAKTASSTNTSVAQLGEGILTIGATAKSIKGGTAELNTALGILANNGIKGAEGGTHLRNIILSLQNPTDKAAAQMEALGVSVYDSEGNMRSMNDILGDLNTSMDGMTSEDKANIISTIFNKTDLSSVNALLANTGSTWDSLQSSIENSAGAAQQIPYF